MLESMSSGRLSCAFVEWGTVGGLVYLGAIAQTIWRRLPKR
jgi:hypothetical protein